MIRAFFRRLYKPRVRLEQLQVVSECPVPEEESAGTESTTYCEHCQLTVYDFSQMTRREIRKTIDNEEERVCAVLTRDESGRLITAPEPPRTPHALRLMSLPAWIGLVGMPQLVGRGCAEQSVEEVAEAEPVEVEFIDEQPQRDEVGEEEETKAVQNQTESEARQRAASQYRRMRGAVRRVEPQENREKAREKAIEKAREKRLEWLKAIAEDE